MAAIKTKRPYIPRHWTLAQRLAFYSAPPNENGCVLWTGPIRGTSYGQICWDGHGQYVHRIVWIEANGPIPAGLFVCHTCDVPLCINLDHLFLGAPIDNTTDMMAKGRGPIGERAWGVRLNENQVRTIRSDARTHQAIANDYGVSASNISMIKGWRTWRHIQS